MRLILTDASSYSSAHEKFQGFYFLSKDNSYGFPYWTQQNDNHAIWYQRSMGWTVGNEEFLGQDYPGIIGPNNVTAWPTLISDGYQYFDGSYWQPAILNHQVIFEDCKYFNVKRFEQILTCEATNSKFFTGTNRTDGNCKPWCICGPNGVQQCESNEALVSLYYPNSYQRIKNLHCSHQISVEPGEVITIEFLEFGVSILYIFLSNFHS